MTATKQDLHIPPPVCVANLALEVGANAYVLRKGRVVFDGPCDELRGDGERLHEFYFGAVPAGAGDEAGGENR